LEFRFLDHKISGYGNNKSMKYKICDKCGEFVTKTGFISSKPAVQENSYFASCHNKTCLRRFSQIKYERLKEKEF